MANFDFLNNLKNKMSELFSPTGGQGNVQPLPVSPQPQPQPQQLPVQGVPPGISPPPDNLGQELGGMGQTPPAIPSPQDMGGVPGQTPAGMAFGNPTLEELLKIYFTIKSLFPNQ